MSDMQLLDYVVLLAVSTLGSLIAIALVVGGVLLWDEFREYRAFRRAVVPEDWSPGSSGSAPLGGRLPGGAVGARASSSAPEFPPEL